MIRHLPSPCTDRDRHFRRPSDRLSYNTVGANQDPTNSFHSNVLSVLPTRPAPPVSRKFLPDTRNKK
ncbi:hypothetical protein NEIMUCOT_05058 [Neisseria mucosa ATCC 25996]|uniref:Uncharacterized protein n=1 Tax=Neisseria mucosa (strain ATCC 25996 / DSM 4631 / NCTC 10774 / M26) TaxID=546266 RepID=D2ZWR0_NEIM2|nr:hypothetical protein NEIMUCOT_05058 [Neisseria mucosa ATCC 25996]